MLVGLQAWMVGPETWPTIPRATPADLGVDGWTDVRREFLPILQQFVPYWGCCPMKIWKNEETDSENFGAAAQKENKEGNKRGGHKRKKS